MKVVTAAQMAAIEQASARCGVSVDALKENAGWSVAQAARGEPGGVAGTHRSAGWPRQQRRRRMVVARHLRGWGTEVICCLLARHPEIDLKLELARRYGVEILPFPDTDVLERLRQQGTRLRLRSDAPQRHNMRRRADNMTASGKSVKAVFGDGKLTA